MDIDKIYIFDRTELIQAFNLACGCRSKKSVPEPTLEKDQSPEEASEPSD
jgi:hypothetical protein